MEEREITETETDLHGVDRLHYLVSRAKRLATEHGLTVAFREYVALPNIEENYSQLPNDLPRICGYEATWDTDLIYFKNVTSIPADLPQSTVEFLHDSCIKLFQRLGCQDYARFDWRLDSNGRPRLLEANPRPGWCWEGHIAPMAGYAGLSYAEMLSNRLAACFDRVAQNGRRAEHVRAA